MTGSSLAAAFAPTVSIKTTSKIIIVRRIHVQFVAEAVSVVDRAAVWCAHSMETRSLPLQLPHHRAETVVRLRLFAVRNYPSQQCAQGRGRKAARAVLRPNLKGDVPLREQYLVRVQRGILRVINAR